MTKLPDLDIPRPPGWDRAQQWSVAIDKVLRQLEQMYPSAVEVNGSLDRVPDGGSIRYKWALRNPGCACWTRPTRHSCDRTIQLRPMKVDGGTVIALSLACPGHGSQLFDLSMPDVLDETIENALQTFLRETALASSIGS